GWAGDRNRSDHHTRHTDGAARTARGGDTSMADASEAKVKGEVVPAAPAAAANGGRRSMAIRLVPVGNSDQPVVANYSSVDIAPGLSFIDFGFIEPGTLAALPRMARQGGKMPGAIGGSVARPGG